MKRPGTTTISPSLIKDLLFETIVYDANCAIDDDRDAGELTENDWISSIVVGDLHFDEDGHLEVEWEAIIREV